MLPRRLVAALMTLCLSAPGASVCDVLENLWNRQARAQEALGKATEAIGPAEQALAQARERRAANPGVPPELAEARARAANLQSRLDATQSELSSLAIRLPLHQDLLRHAEDAVKRAAEDVRRETEILRQAERVAAATRAELEQNERVRGVRVKVRGLEDQIAEATGRSLAPDWEALGPKLRDPAFRGDSGCRLFRLHDELRTVQTALDAVFRVRAPGAPTEVELEEKKTALLSQIRELLSRTEANVESLRKAVEEELASAEERALTGPRGEEMRAELDEVKRVRARLKQASEQKAQADRKLEEARTELNRTRAREAEMRNALAGIEPELAAAKTELARLETATPDLDNEVLAARQKVNAAKQELAAAEAELARIDRQVRQRTGERDALAGGITTRIGQAKDLLNLALKSNREGDAAQCAEQVKAARTAIEAAASLYQSNANCSALAGMREQVDYALALPPRVSCGGHTIAPLRGDGMVTVPSVLGKPVEAARQALAAVSLRAFDYEYRPAPTRELEGTVSGQDPAPASRVAAGTRVSLARFGKVPAEEPSPEPVPPPPVKTAPNSGFTAAGPPKVEGGGAPGIPSDAELDEQARRAKEARKHPPGYVNPWERNAKAHVASCNMKAALQAADILASEDPTNAWLGTAYAEIVREVRGAEYVEGLLAQAQGALQQGNLALGVQLTQQAQAYVTRCTSQRVSGLAPAIAAAVAAQQQANREASRQAMGDLLGALGPALGAIAAARGGGVPSPASGGPPAGGSAAGAAAAMAGVPPASGAPAACNACSLVDTAALPSQRVFYLYEQRFSSPAPGTPCGNRTFTVYSLFGSSPTDEQGRPAPSDPQMERGLSTLPNATKVCGPCGTYQQSLNLLRSHCPNPTPAVRR